MAVTTRMHVILFVKYPQPGSVKTRLAASIGPAHAAGLYRAFVQDELRTLTELRADCSIYCAPEFPEHKYRSWLPGHTLHTQHGADLGARMHHALSEVLATQDRVLLIGSDLPDLPASLLQQAWNALEHCPLCFGAAEDGGFYLIGATRHGLNADIFRGVTWSTSSVLQTTLANCAAQGLASNTLSSWPDVDTQEDLRALMLRQTVAPHTRNYIQTKALENFWKH